MLGELDTMKLRRVPSSNLGCFQDKTLQQVQRMPASGSVNRTNTKSEESFRYLTKDS